MNKNSLDNEIIKLLSETFFLDPKKINEKTSMDNIKNWDSLKHMTLVLAIEEHFNIKFTGEEIIEMHNFASIKKCIIKKNKN
tara:strand:- start:478 stop:723 length:246 start_codon:yes stop_codon:yes gene_type:complete